ncbi:MAG: MerR family transcriptional regulator [Desulfuromonas sp.]|mgnify:CR=1 FL=1|nr:MAG: MerR family transcriptional regulator [Desulfuromonas sp.]
MALGKTWYDPEEASAKFGIPVERILEWVDEGLVRTEKGDGAVRVNIDDLKLEVQNYIAEE